jgi:UDP-N-acetylmuramoyl-tripeptide--D-alanyl-D-alanine ligase
MSCKIELSRVLESVDGEWVRECGACEIDGVGTDTRVDLTGRLFIALKGDSFDAHDFIDKAIDAGAVALIVDRDLSKSPIWEKVQQHDVAVIQVHDTLRALQDLAQFWRSQLSAKVLAISGSNGKTTTKEFAKAICSTTKNTVASPASFNNHWGVPLSILSAPIETEVLILEMGMNHSGELTRLTEIASPDVALVTNVGRAHIGHFESIQQVAAAKAELYQDGRDGMIRIFNLDNEYTLRMYNSFKGRSEMMTFSSFNSEADVQLRAESLNLKGLIVSGRVNSVEGKKSVPVFGRHNVANLMAASALALTAGLSAQQVWAGLERCQTTWGRNQLIELSGGVTALFDGYNANPESVEALLKNLYEVEGVQRRWVALGEMLEMGTQAESLHRELGKKLTDYGFDGVCFIGSSFEAFREGIQSGSTSMSCLAAPQFSEEMARDFRAQMSSGDVVVLKGSRGMKMERFLSAWGASAKI